MNQDQLKTECVGQPRLEQDSATLWRMTDTQQNGTMRLNNSINVFGAGNDIYQRLSEQNRDEE